MILVKNYMKKSYEFYQSNTVLHEHTLDDIIDYHFDLYQRSKPLLINPINRT